MSVSEPQLGDVSHETTFESAIRSTDHTLWEAYQSSTDIARNDGSTNLRFPKYRNGQIRVSEQEARFTFVSEIAKGPLLYSVEAPTGQVYQFKGKVIERSGATDIAVFTPDFEPLANVEFKAHGYSDTRQDRSSLKKDMKKLLKEPVFGCWFHTLKGVNGETMRKFWSVFKKDLRDTALPIGIAVDSAELLLHICVLRQPISFERRLTVPAEIPDSWLEQIAPPDLSVTREKVTVKNTNDWHVSEL